ncbi:hypothetical protein ACRALDRAFT_1081465 [Sodiomyces alcalophilus JCM 7366]|uniref:uncharacterized protein n=1 Tax=Sodiomyces alcalophilus JCM 7366 TaxID=591952 RepID=UPI0039B48521
MQYRSIASLAVVALAAQATAQQTRMFTRANQSFRDLGVFRRQDDGYQPEDEICSGEGTTCAEACGEGYEQCSSSDSAVHCFSPAAGESCCTTGTGSSCLAAFYCTHDTDAETWCCPEGRDLEQCAADFGVAGGLILDVRPEPIASVVESSSSSQAPESTSEVVVPSSSAVAVETSSYVPPTSSIVPTSSIPWYANTTTSAYHVPSVTAPADDEEDVDEEEDDDEDAIEEPTTEPTPSPSNVEEGAAGTVHSSASLALVAGIAFAAILL